MSALKHPAFLVRRTHSEAKLSEKSLEDGVPAADGTFGPAPCQSRSSRWPDWLDMRAALAVKLPLSGSAGDQWCHFCHLKYHLVMVRERVNYQQGFSLSALGPRERNPSDRSSKDQRIWASEARRHVRSEASTMTFFFVTFETYAISTWQEPHKAMFSGEDGPGSGNLLPPEPCPCPCRSWDFIDRLLWQQATASRRDRRQLQSSSMPFRLTAFKGRQRERRNSPAALALAPLGGTGQIIRLGR